MFKKNTRIPFPHFPQIVSTSSQIRFNTVQHLGNRYLICQNCPIIIVPVLRDIVETMSPTTHKIQLSVVLFSLFYLHDPKNEISNFVYRDIKFLCSSMQMCFHYVRDIQFRPFPSLVTFLYARAEFILPFHCAVQCKVQTVNTCLVTRASLGKHPFARTSKCIYCNLLISESGIRDSGYCMLHKQGGFQNNDRFRPRDGLIFFRCNGATFYSFSSFCPNDTEQSH